MDHAFALRLVVFEYLLPQQRKRRAQVVTNCILSEMPECHLIFNVGDMFDRLLRISDALLSRHGFPTSYVLPCTMHHANYRIHEQTTVNALVDSPGPYDWSLNGKRTRIADPCYGLRCFENGVDMPRALLSMN